ncbi:unnamed protein product [Prorocentrum cordatum]|uniref:Uncharacterized protein n=1 Tax=Prorocentrum cordatum TaxID=2364126 RepID=A0ABN9UBX9_9DINO|nr:unnamed protein product [Polarella glacialis]
MENLMLSSSVAKFEDWKAVEALRVDVCYTDIGEVLSRLTAGRSPQQALPGHQVPSFLHYCLAIRVPYESFKAQDDGRIWSKYWFDWSVPSGRPHALERCNSTASSPQVGPYPALKWFKSARVVAVRHGHCVAHCRTVEEAARLIQLLASDSPDASVLDGFEQGLRGAGVKLGLGRKATSEEVRRALAKAQPELARRWVAMRGGRRWAAHPDRDLLQEVMEALDAHPGTIGSEQDEAGHGKLEEKANTTALLAEKVLELQAADQRYHKLLADTSEEQRALELKVQMTEDEAAQLSHRSHEQSQKISQLEQALAELQERRGAAAGTLTPVRRAEGRAPFAEVPAFPHLASGSGVPTEELEVGVGEGQQNTAYHGQSNGDAKGAYGDQKSTEQNQGRHLNIVKTEERNGTAMEGVGSEFDDQGGTLGANAEEVSTKGGKDGSAGKNMQGAVGNQQSTVGNKGSHLCTYATKQSTSDVQEYQARWGAAQTTPSRRTQRLALAAIENRAWRVSSAPGPGRSAPDCHFHDGFVCLAEISVDEDGGAHGLGPEGEEYEFDDSYVVGGEMVWLLQCTKGSPPCHMYSELCLAASEEEPGRR